MGWSVEKAACVHDLGLVVEKCIAIPTKELHKLDFEIFKLTRVPIEFLKGGEVEIRPRGQMLLILGLVKLVLKILILMPHEELCLSLGLLCLVMKLLICKLKLLNSLPQHFFR